MKKISSILSPIIWMIILTPGVLTQQYSKIVLKTCEGCALAHYPTIVKFIKYDLEHYNVNSQQIVTNYDAGGDPRFVVLDQDNEIARVLDISQLSLKQIRFVAKKLGFQPQTPLMSLKQVTETYLTDKMKEGEGDDTGAFDQALGLDRHIEKVIKNEKVQDFLDQGDNAPTKTVDSEKIGLN